MGRRRVFGPTRGTAGQPERLHDRSRSGASWSTDGLLYFGTGVFDLVSGDRKCCFLVCLRWPAVDAASLLASPISRCRGSSRGPDGTPSPHLHIPRDPGHSDWTSTRECGIPTAAAGTPSRFAYGDFPYCTRFVISQIQ
ncbi:unnamed protein product [Urochloa humidicola]